MQNARILEGHFRELDVRIKLSQDKIDGIFFRFRTLRRLDAIDLLLIQFNGLLYERHRRVQ
jgi:hypothetical protein